MRTPFEKRTLFCAKNMLKIKSASSQRVSITIDSRFDFGTNDFTVSAIFSDTTGSGKAIFFSNPVVADANNINIHAASNNSITFRITTTTDVIYSFTASNLPDLNKNIIRVTLIRRGLVIECWINEHIFSSIAISGSDAFNFGGGELSLGGSIAGGSINGSIGAFIVLSEAITDIQLESMHRTNLPSADIHMSVLGHWLLNSSSGTKALDVVEFYNYAKSTLLSAEHGTLINYSSDDAGTNSQVTQVAWQNTYLKEKRGNRPLKFNGSTGYADIPSYTNVNPSQWTLYIDAYFDHATAALQTLFNSSNVNAQNAIFWVSSTNMQAYYNGNATNIAVKEKTKYKFALNYDGTTVRLYVNGIGVLGMAAPNFQFDYFLFSGDFVFPRFSEQGTIRAIFYSRYINFDIATTPNLEVNKIYNSDRSDDYRSSLPDFDIDFGDVFLVGSDYFARDNSGNARHSQLHNWTPTTDPGYYYESDSQLPVRRKALRFVRAQNTYAEVAAMGIVSTQGYTTIVGFCLDANRNFSGTPWEVLSASSARFLLGINGTTVVNGFSDPNGVTGDLRKVQRPQFVAITETGTTNFKRFYSNGFMTLENSPGGNPTNITGSLTLGGISGNATAGLDGYITHYSMFKGVLTPEQIARIVNSGIEGNANPQEMPNCWLYLNFEEIHVSGSTYTIKDWSPQNHTVTLFGYTSNNVDPLDPAYLLFDLDSLR